MNRIYKVIWSKVKHQYVVVSELAHSCTKGAAISAGRHTAAVLTVLALTAGVGIVPAWAADVHSENVKNSVAVGNNSSVNANVEEASVYGYMANANQNYSTALGGFAEATGQFGSATGYNASAAESAGSQALADNSTAIGSNSVIDVTSEGGATLGNNTAIGSNSDGAIAIGGDPDTNDEETTAATVGNNATNAIAMGTNATVNDNGQNSIAIGNGATISENSTASIAMGLNAQVDTAGNNAIAIGSSAHAGGVGGIAIGKKAGTIGATTGAVAIGINAQAASNSIVMGQNAIADAAQTVAIGYGAKSHSGYGAAIGAFAEVGSNSYGLALGGYSRVGNSAMKSIAIGTSGRGYTEGRTEVKDGASYSIAMGGKTTVGENAKQSVAIGGYQAIVGDNAKYSTAIGTFSDIAANVEYGTAVGYNTNVDANCGTALGNGASANGEWSTALGASTDAKQQATAVGSNAQALAGNSVAVGVNSSVAEGADYSVALGTSSKVEEGDAFTTTDLEDFKKKLGDTYNAAWNITSADGTLGVVSVGAKGKERRLVNVARGRIDADSTDAVNGSQLYGLASDLNEKIENAGGDWVLTTNGGTSPGEQTTIGKGNTVDFTGAKDAETEHQNIQVSQAQVKDGKGNVIGTDVSLDLNDDLYLGDVNQGSGAYVNVFGSTAQIMLGKGSAAPIVIDGDTGTISGLSNLEWNYNSYLAGTYDGSTLAATESQLHDAFGYLDDKINNISITGDDNINVSKPADGEGGTETPGTGSTSPSFDITMSDNPQFGGHADDGQGHAANGSVTVVGTGTDGTAHKVVVDGATGTVSGLSNTEWDWNKYGKPAEEGGYAGSTNAATESQLQGALEGTVQYDRDENGNVDKTNVTLNKGGDSVTIHNVAAGTADTDAVNVSQLNQAWDQINNNTTAITNIGNKVGELDSRIDEVGAGAAALAALHPLDFDPDDKWDFAAGYGNYRGENAVAIGAFYRPNEDTMFSVGGTVGNGDNMVNAGVSFKLGQGNNVSTSRVAMAKEIKSMRDIVAKQDAQIQKLTAMVNALVGMEASAPDTTTMFPDVPENHWAYEAVEMMAKTGLVQGYPDGEFKGDRNMTRYEFAQIVYNAIQAGIKVDERLVQEFRPELEYFRIDTISKDKDGNPVIQRVRANEIPATK